MTSSHGRLEHRGLVEGGHHDREHHFSLGSSSGGPPGPRTHVESGPQRRRTGTPASETKVRGRTRRRPVAPGFHFERVRARLTAPRRRTRASARRHNRSISVRVLVDGQPDVETGPTVRRAARPPGGSRTVARRRPGHQSPRAASHVNITPNVCMNASSASGAAARPVPSASRTATGRSCWQNAERGEPGLGLAPGLFEPRASSSAARAGRRVVATRPTAAGAAASSRYRASASRGAIQSGPASASPSRSTQRAHRELVRRAQRPVGARLSQRPERRRVIAPDVVDRPRPRRVLVVRRGIAEELGRGRERDERCARLEHRVAQHAVDDVGSFGVTPAVRRRGAATRVITPSLTGELSHSSSRVPADRGLPRSASSAVIRRGAHRRPGPHHVDVAGEPAPSSVRYGARARADVLGRHQSRGARRVADAQRRRSSQVASSTWSAASPAAVVMSSSASTNQSTPASSERHELREQRRAVRRRTGSRRRAPARSRSRSARRRPRQARRRAPGARAAPAAVVRLPPRARGACGSSFGAYTYAFIPVAARNAMASSRGGVRPRWSVEALDHAAHGERTGHDGRLPAPRRRLRGDGRGPGSSNRSFPTLAPDLLAAHAASTPDRARSSSTAPVVPDPRRRRSRSSTRS